MAYALTLLAALGLFLWASPARTVITERLHQASTITQQLASSSSDALRSQAASAVNAVHTKAMELLRQQLHGTIDELVK
jgi:hypothetical protein